MNGLGRCQDSAKRRSSENDRTTDRDWIKTAFLPLIVLYLMTEGQRDGKKYNNDTFKRIGIVFYDIQSGSRLSQQTISSLIVYNLETTKSNKY